MSIQVELFCVSFAGNDVDDDNNALDDDVW